MDPLDRRGARLAVVEVALRRLAEEVAERLERVGARGNQQDAERQ